MHNNFNVNIVDIVFPHLCYFLYLSFVIVCVKRFCWFITSSRNKELLNTDKNEEKQSTQKKYEFLKATQIYVNQNINESRLLLITSVCLSFYPFQHWEAVNSDFNSKICNQFLFIFELKEAKWSWYIYQIDFGFNLKNCFKLLWMVQVFHLNFWIPPTYIIFSNYKCVSLMQLI